MQPWLIASHFAGIGQYKFLTWWWCWMKSQRFYPSYWKSTGGGNHCLQTLVAINNGWPWMSVQNLMVIHPTVEKIQFESKWWTNQLCHPRSMSLVWLIRIIMDGTNSNTQVYKMSQSEEAEQCCLQQKMKSIYGPLSHMDLWSGTVLTWDFPLHLSPPHRCLFLW